MAWVNVAVGGSGYDVSGDGEVGSGGTGDVVPAECKVDDAGVAAGN